MIDKKMRTFVMKMARMIHRREGALYPVSYAVNQRPDFFLVLFELKMAIKDQIRDRTR